MTTYTHVLHSSAVSGGKNPSYALPDYELLYVLSKVKNTLMWARWAGWTQMSLREAAHTGQVSACAEPHVANLTT